MLYFSIFLVAISCQSKETKNSTVNIDTFKLKASTGTVIKINPEHIILAAKKDLVCGMPEPRYLEDTASFKGKVYGFCSKECKEEFLTAPATYIKAK